MSKKYKILRFFALVSIELVDRFGIIISFFITGNRSESLDAQSSKSLELDFPISRYVIYT